MNAHVRARAGIAAHFAGRVTLAEERAMRAHCAECCECRAFYERHLLLAELDPAALTAQERLGRGLGLARPKRLPALLGGALALAAACAAFWLAPSQAREPAFVARGGAPERTARLDVYVMSADGSSQPAPARIERNAELAFAYASPEAHGYLLVFGVDEHGHVFWYHPAWSDPARNPSALAIANTPGTVELPEAVAESLDGTRLELIGLFVTAPLTVREVEAAVQQARVHTQPLEQALATTFSKQEPLFVVRELEVSQ